MITLHELDEKCGSHTSKNLTPKESIDWFGCAKDLLKGSEELTLARIESGERNVSGGPPDWRGTTGRTVSQEETHVVVERRSSGRYDELVFKEQKVDNISSDPALGPRSKVKGEREIDESEALGKVVEVSHRSK